MADPVEHELTPDQRGGIHRVQLTAGVEHRFTIMERDFITVGPVQVLSIDGGASIFGTIGEGHDPAVIDGPDCFIIPPAIGAVTQSTGRWSPTVVRLIADGPVLVSVQRAKGDG